MDKRTEKVVLKVALGFLAVLILGISSLLVVALMNDEGADSAATVNDQGISRQQAIALASSVVEGKVTEVEFGDGIYEVEIMDGETEYDIEIDAATGKVIKVEKENELGRRDLEVIKPKISEDQAKKIALSNVEGKVTDLEAKKVNGLYVYEVEIQNNGQEADVRVNMMTGKVEGIERDVIENDDDDEEDEEEIDVPITGTALERASAVALEYIGEGRVTDTEVGDEEGYYEIEIRLDNGKEIDVHLDEDFNVLSTEMDDEDDIHNLSFSYLLFNAFCFMYMTAEQKIGFEFLDSFPDSLASWNKIRKFSH